MTTRAVTTPLAALCLSLLPMAASAKCGHDEARLSCAQGTVWDEAAKACVTTTS
ncbi:hypothetical protein [Frigidibacter mobilis]|uniref:Chitin binding peritrophin-A-like protein n=1 Tax=Frigidibacter mobilis TaxID=1335048 RepID=A0A165SPJ3_9RHOB|nr:hypothetical protein [Frigidibacter mobilis]AMY69893.1 hypothetical protein AKL17_2652 [Frigidibacter mobilis]